MIGKIIKAATDAAKREIKREIRRKIAKAKRKIVNGARSTIGLRPAAKKRGRR